MSRAAWSWLYVFLPILGGGLLTHQPSDENGRLNAPTQIIVGTRTAVAYTGSRIPALSLSAEDEPRSSIELWPHSGPIWIQ